MPRKPAPSNEPAARGPRPIRAGRLWLVDAYNVLRVSLAPAAGEPWWSAERRELLRTRVLQLREPGISRVEVCLVFDAGHLSSTEEAASGSLQVDEPSWGGGDGAPDDASQPLVRVLFTPSADEWIVGAARRRSDEFDRVRVVTADRRLADRARSRGAEVVDTGRFLALCPPPG